MGGRRLIHSWSPALPRFRRCGGLAVGGGNSFGPANSEGREIPASAPLTYPILSSVGNAVSAGEPGPHLRQPGHGFRGKRPLGGDFNGLIKVLQARNTPPVRCSLRGWSGRTATTPPPGCSCTPPAAVTGSPQPGTGPGRSRGPNRWARRSARRRGCRVSSPLNAPAARTRITRTPMSLAAARSIWFP